MTIEEVKELIKIDETRVVEFKKTTGELKDAMHSVCAMLNSDGGYVIIGIAPKSLNILGQIVSDKTRQEIAWEIRKLEPFVNMAVEYVDVPDSDGKQLIIFHADKNLFTEAPYVFDGKPYYKLESTTMQMPQQLYINMLRSREPAQFKWDSLTAPNKTIEDLDEKRIRNAVTMGVRSGRLSQSAENESIAEVLNKLKLLNDGKPTNAAVMLFAKDTSDYPEMELKMGYFKGTNKMVFIDNKMETGNFFDLLEAGISFCFRNLRLSGEVKGLLREEKLEIPDEALREALTNALCHRQYERTNGSVSLAIYDDRVELVNPGTFPPQLTEESIRSNHESYPYNKRIAQVLYLTKNLEKWGTGANRMIDLCREQGVPEPEWKVGNGTVSIIFKRPFVTLANEESSEDDHRNFIETSQKKCEKFIETLQKKDREIAELVITNSEITQNEMAKVLGITTRAVANRLKSMQERDIIKRVGPDNGGHWELIISA